MSNPGNEPSSNHDQEATEVRSWQQHWSQQTDPAHRWSDPEMLRRLAREQLGHLDGGTTLLDLGCGSGSILQHLAPSFQHTLACDPSPAMLGAARQLLRSQAVTLVQADDTTMWSQLGGFRPDRISCTGVVQYLPPGRLAGLIREAARHMSDDGRIGLFEIIDPRLYPLFVDGRLGKQPISWWQRRLRHTRHRYVCLRRRLAGLPSDPIGRAYAPWDVARLAESVGLSAVFPRSAWYEYRYHAILSRRG